MACVLVGVGKVTQMTSGGVRGRARANSRFLTARGNRHRASSSPAVYIPMNRDPSYSYMRR